MHKLLLLSVLLTFTACSSSNKIKTAQNITIDKRVLASVCDDCSDVSEIVKRYEKIGGDIKALAQAFCMVKSYHSKSQTGYGNHVFYINDLNRDSREPRFYAVNMKNGMVAATYSMHGRSHKPSLKKRYMADTSWQNDSRKTPPGMHLVRTKLQKQGNGSEHYLMDGVQPMNKNSHARLITFWLASDKFMQRFRATHKLDGIVIADTEKEIDLAAHRLNFQVTTKGSVGVTQRNYEQLVRAIEADSQDPRGAMVYNYTKFEKLKPTSYCDLR